MVLHEDRGSGSSAQSFNPQRAAACKKIKHPRSWHKIAKGGKNRSPDPVHRGACSLAGGFQRESTRHSCNHAHGSLSVAGLGRCRFAKEALKQVAKASEIAPDADAGEPFQ